MFAADVLKDLGYDVHPLACQMTNDPDFSGVKSSNPENAEAMTLGMNLGTRLNADLVVATDPDADRVAIAVPEGNTFRKLSGNELGCLLYGSLQ